MGRNLAMMELLIIISTIFWRYEFVLENEDEEVSDRVSHSMTSYAYLLKSNHAASDPRRLHTEAIRLSSWDEAKGMKM